MPKFPSLKSREVERILLRNGFEKVRHEGSHRTYFNKKTRRMTVVSFHTGDVPRGTVRGIIKQSGLPEKLFRK